MLLPCWDSLTHSLDAAANWVLVLVPVLGSFAGADEEQPAQEGFAFPPGSCVGHQHDEEDGEMQMGAAERRGRCSPGAAELVAGRWSTLERWSLGGAAGWRPLCRRAKAQEGQKQGHPGPATAACHQLHRTYKSFFLIDAFCDNKVLYVCITVAPKGHKATQESLLGDPHYPEAAQRTQPCN